VSLLLREGRGWKGKGWYSWGWVGKGQVWRDRCGVEWDGSSGER